MFMQRSASGDLRWCITLLPTHAGAQEAGMSLADYEAFVYGAMLLDRDDPDDAWQAQGREQQRMADFLPEVRELRFVARDTDLRLAVEGDYDESWRRVSAAMDKVSEAQIGLPAARSVRGPITLNAWLCIVPHQEEEHAGYLKDWVRQAHAATSSR